MLIDWFTVAAQVLNFAVLVWLMKRFLYQPVLDAIDAREKRVAAVLADAAAKQAEAQRERDEFRARQDEFERQRAALLAQAAQDAQAERRRLLDAARQAADALAAARRAALRSDSQRLGQALVRRTQQEVFAIARKALADLATASLEERIAEVFIARLKALDGPARDCLARALAQGPGPALVRSAFELPAGSRAAIQCAVDDAFATGVRLRFDSAPGLVGGIELVANGQKVAWSIAGYLGSLQQEVDEATQAQPAAASASP
jgi:F-type H+-transporting ATPase subunit b